MEHVFCVAEALLRTIEPGQLTVGYRIPGIELNRQFELGRGLGRLALFGQHGAQSDVPARQLGIQFHSASGIRPGCLQQRRFPARPITKQLRIGQTDVSQSEFPVLLNRRLELLECAVDTAGLIVTVEITAAPQISIVGPGELGCSGDQRTERFESRGIEQVADLGERHVFELI